MNRFDCPRCGGSLRRRLLPHVPGVDGRIAFSCIHCKATLSYSKDHMPFTDPFLRTGLRTLFTVVGGMALVSGISRLAGKPVAIAALAFLAAFLFGAYFFSKKPAYEVIRNGRSDKADS